MEELGCKVTITVTPHVAGSASKITAPQRAFLGTLARHGFYRSEKHSRTIKALLRKGLITARYVLPAPGNDYGGAFEYRLTEAGKVILGK